MDEVSWRPLQYQIERDDPDSEPTTFTIYVTYTYPSDDKKWDFHHSSYRLIRLDGMVLFNITITSGEHSTRG